MAKVKIPIDSKKVNKFIVACDISDIRIIDQLKAGDITIMVCTFKHPSQLFTAGQMLDKVSDSYERKQPDEILNTPDNAGKETGTEKPKK